MPRDQVVLSSTLFASTNPDLDVELEVTSVEARAVEIPGEGTDAADATPVADIMSRRVICVTRDVSIAALTALLDDRNLGGVPVVDEHDDLIGMVSKSDVVRLAHEDELTVSSPTMSVRPARPDLADEGLHDVEIDTRTVGDIMMPMAFSVPVYASVAHAAAIMASEGVHRLPVLDEEGCVVGLVTTSDVVRWVASRAGYMPARSERAA